MPNTGFMMDEHYLVRDGKLVAKERRKKVCILGFAPSMADAPFTDEDMDIWTLNEAYVPLSKMENARASLLFEIHSPDSPSKSNVDHQNFLQTCPVPIIMQEHFDKYPNSVAYPKDEILAMVRGNYIVNDKCMTYTNFSNQITWMIYLAVYMGFEEIHVYGVDMAHESEYAWQRPSAEAAIAFAAGRGIKVCVPSTSELCHFPRLYGFETDNAGRHYKKKRKKDLTAKVNRMSAEVEQMEKQIFNHKLMIAQVQGALQEIEHDLTNAIV